VCLCVYIRLCVCVRVCAFVYIRVCAFPPRPQQHGSALPVSSSRGSLCWLVWSCLTGTLLTPTASSCKVLHNIYLLWGKVSPRCRYIPTSPSSPIKMTPASCAPYNIITYCFYSILYWMIYCKLLNISSYYYCYK
jgi:hypothetical protein